jgi:hypothetical protein
MGAADYAFCHLERSTNPEVKFMPSRKTPFPCALAQQSHESYSYDAAVSPMIATRDAPCAPCRAPSARVESSRTQNFR